MRFSALIPAQIEMKGLFLARRLNDKFPEIRRQWWLSQRFVVLFKGKAKDRIRHDGAIL